MNGKSKTETFIPYVQISKQIKMKSNIVRGKNKIYKCKQKKVSSTTTTTTATVTTVELIDGESKQLCKM